MTGALKSESVCMTYELEIEIEASIETVWEALIHETNLWWLPDFHMVDSDSTVEFDLSAGGRGLVEHSAEGGFLQWFAVQYYLPQQHKIYLVGNLAPDFGGPSTTNLCLAVISSGSGCTLKVTDAHHGNVNEQTVESLRSGWEQLFTAGLRDFVDSKS